MDKGKALTPSSWHSARFTRHNPILKEKKRKCRISNTQKQVSFLGVFSLTKCARTYHLLLVPTTDEWAFCCVRCLNERTASEPTLIYYSGPERRWRCRTEDSQRASMLHELGFIISVSLCFFFRFAISFFFVSPSVGVCDISRGVTAPPHEET